MTQLYIKWDTGQMTINCEAFFPATQNKLNVLLKTIDLDWEHKEDILKQMLTFLKGLEQDAEDKKKETKKSFGVEHQKMCDLQHVIQDGRFANGVPMSKVELKQAKADLKEQKKLVSGMEQDFKHYSKIAQKSKGQSGHHCSERRCHMLKFLAGMVVGVVLGCLITIAGVVALIMASGDYLD